MLHRPDSESELELLVLNSDNRLLLSCWGDALETTIDQELSHEKNGMKWHAKMIRHLFPTNPDIANILRGTDLRVERSAVCRQMFM